MNARTMRSTLAALLLPLLLLAAVGATPAPAAGPDVPVIVRSHSSSAQASSAVAAVGGEVTDTLDIIDGVAAMVPESQILSLRTGTGIRSVTVDEPVQLLGSGRWKADDDDHSVYNALRAIDAEDYWEEGYTGEGIGVALIDTGVAPVAGLDDPGQVIHGPDLSWESQSANVRHLDTFGHGTHMAGLIAGHDDAIDLADIDDLDEHFTGVAPAAHVISIKVADAQGHTDISQIIAAIDWVVEHRNDPRMNIRVLNLSLGMYSGHAPEDDPLAHATSIAWDRGIVVVAAAGNDGAERTGLTSPAYSERIIAVGAADADGKGKSDHHKWMPLSFSARGDDVRMPDIVAPGRSLPSLRVPGSFLDSTNDGARVTDRFFRGSGTSQAAAIVSGAAALVLHQHPTWTPAMVRGALMENAGDLDPDEGFTPETGLLGLNLHDMDEVEADPSWVTSPTPSRNGTGSLDLARGEVRVAHLGIELDGERDIFGVPVDTTALSEARRRGVSWLGGYYNSQRWTGATMSGSQWSGSQWTGSQWSGSQWSGSQWSGSQWTGSQWTGSQWSSSEYSGSQWSGTNWSSGTWE